MTKSHHCPHCEFVAVDHRGLSAHLRYRHPDKATPKPKPEKKRRKQKDHPGLPRVPVCQWCSKHFQGLRWWYKHALTCPKRPSFVSAEPAPPVRVWWIDHDGGDVQWISYTKTRDEAVAEFAQFVALLTRPVRQIEKSPPVYQAQIALGLISPHAE